MNQLEMFKIPIKLQEILHVYTSFYEGAFFSSDDSVTRLFHPGIDKNNKKIEQGLPSHLLPVNCFRHEH